MLTKGGSPVSFVEYQDTNHAAVAMAMLQGFVLSPERGGVRIEFAKTKMTDGGKRSATRLRRAGAVEQCDARGCRLFVSPGKS